MVTEVVEEMEAMQDEVKGTQEWEFFGSDFEFCTISLLVMLKY